MCLQSMHEILGDLHAFPGVFDSVVGNMTNVSRDIMEHVKCPILREDSYSRLSGDRKSRRNSCQSLSTTVRTAGICATGGPVTALDSARLTTNRYSGGFWCFQPLGCGMSTYHSHELYKRNSTAREFSGKCYQNPRERAIVPLGVSSPTGSVA